MADTLSYRFKASAFWTNTETRDLENVLTDSRLDYDKSFTDGTGSNQVEIQWTDTVSIAGGGGSTTFDLRALDKVIYGGTVTVVFSKVRQIVFRNHNTVSGDDLLIGNAGANPWSAPFGAGTHTLRCCADSILPLTNGMAGFTVSAGSSQNLKIATINANAVSVSVLIVGNA